ncbi:methyl-accepting chemotaxis protein [Parachitinimonas caeni]|uniref:Methyl-accepting chemotaxis protein n=1 Tax=Parachitinimonas caeni TaxID=3031301 RepID=A0ABT7DWE4_9NEIS|nr:methyl-accepting chemotaxis protein [Parachitinimonas caeni]MDK2124384.1 methyl-accepting chemotaxis protein [Parachitinimonas caeni]
MLPSWQLRTKVLVAAALAVLAGFTLMITVIAQSIYSSAEAIGLARAQEQADAFAQRVSDRFEQGFMLPRTVAQSVVGMQSATLPDRKILTAMVSNVLANTPGATGMWMLWEPNALDGKDADFVQDWPLHDPSGRFTPYLTRSPDGKVQVEPMMDDNERKKAEPFRQNPAGYKPSYEESGWGDFYKVPKERGKETVTEPFPYEVLGKKVLMSSLAVPIRANDGKFLGIAAVDLPMNTLQAELSQLKPFGVGHLTLISSGGNYVVNLDPAKIGKALDAASTPPNLMQTMQAGQSMQTDNGSSLEVWKSIKVGRGDQYWMLGVNIPKSAITDSAAAARNKAIGVGAIATALIVLVIGILLTTLTRPLAHLATTMEALATGEGDLTRRLAVNSQDEIGRTSQAFNQFMARLRDMFVQVRQESEAVGRAAHHLAQSATQVESSSDEQTEAATSTAAAVEQVTVSIQHIAATARDFEASARQTGEATREGRQLVEKVASEIDLVHRNVDTLAAAMSSLSQQSAQVDNILRAIKDIAEQTNLLALNAAIEAARAGEQGRGFAVVADEVRKLAARTAEATIEIGQIVNQIQKEIGSADSSVKLTRNSISNSVAISHEAASAIGGVGQATEKLVNNIGEIADSTREQAAASTDIARNVEKISVMAQSNRDVVASVSVDVDTLGKLSTSLTQLVARFKT